jgi:hypothetical protein
MGKVHEMDMRAFVRFGLSREEEQFGQFCLG